MVDIQHLSTQKYILAVVVVYGCSFPFYNTSLNDEDCEM